MNNHRTLAVGFHNTIFTPVYSNRIVPHRQRQKECII
jgi:hypothetical protein